MQRWRVEPETGRPAHIPRPPKPSGPRCPHITASCILNQVVDPAVAVFPSVPDRGGGWGVGGLAFFFLEELPKKLELLTLPCKTQTFLSKNNRLPTRLSLEKNEDFNFSWSLTYPLMSFYKVFKRRRQVLCYFLFRIPAILLMPSTQSASEFHLWASLASVSR